MTASAGAIAAPVGVLAVFTPSPFKLPHYGLPAYPAVALLAAQGMSKREIADTLFGITMEEPGCSKLVNVNLRTFGDRKAA